MENTLINGDCLESLKKMPDNSIDSMVTDPPAGIAFMGKSWDKDKGGRKLWIAWLESIMTEAFRTLKPGAHILVWAIPRTSHWTATAIENADFEIRDVVTHIFGSGFPKSQNISKAIDRQAGVKRKVVGKRKHPTLKDTTKLDEKAAAAHGKNTWTREWDITAPATNDAKHWDGWGTALKPASEHWILARKPLSEKTIAANVLEHSTGGINIDASRIGTDVRTYDLKGGENLNKLSRENAGDSEDAKGCGAYGTGAKQVSIGKATVQGRFPANLILSHKPGCKQVGTKEGKGYTINRFTDGAKPFGNGAGHPYKVEDQGPETIAVWECDDNCAVKQLGEENRFFYCAKASKKEKTLNNTIENKHPTVKSLKLMKYLINLVTPPGGVVLDPFMGSGTTGQAALEDDFGFVGIELEADSFEICKKRCASVKTLIINKKIEEKSIDQVALA